MEYHQDRFKDHSLMVFKEQKLIAVLPGNIAESSVISHQGLTYGGLVLAPESKFEDAKEALKHILKFLEDKGVSTLELKLLPSFYHSLPSDELNYLMFKLNAQLTRTDMASVIDMRNPLEITSSNRKRNLQKAKNQDVSVREVSEFDEFFNAILIPNLEKRHGTKPTHCAEEIQNLKSYFPDNIRQFNAYYEDEIIAGVTVFETQQVAHAQYISTLDTKREFAGLDAIFDTLINSVFKYKAYFSFGISNENQGQQINSGLLSWKESFGARPIVHEFYRVNTNAANLLDDIML